jgi:hypothetical protein
MPRLLPDWTGTTRVQRSLIPSPERLDSGSFLTQCFAARQRPGENIMPMRNGQ